MSYLVLAYPQISKHDLDWIQSLREKYDEKYYEIVGPHFTIVFPVDDIDKQSFVKHVTEKVKTIGKFYFVLRCAQVVKDFFAEYYDVFLVPEEGYRIFVKIHDLLYTDILLDKLRLDIPYIPHLSIGGSFEPFNAKKIADEINAKKLEIIGSVESLDLVSYENNMLTKIASIPLLEK
ncbi:2'-5' RNA ligase family protein [Melioribacteraceae bacterium 4301-Me]|uniref:2'-5' RNA ligase family protein n=1 Tax=Pyranulibacter aquaticus TaxID=3163344 RepID=UPI003597559A